jgi:uncharacterized protein (TIGR02145 family)
LTAGVTYKVRAYATNSKGTGYGPVMEFTTLAVPPFVAPTVIIGTQQWMSQNLNIETYRNGDVIPQVTDPAAWNNLTTGAWCYYNNDPANGAIYGKLYNWYAVTDPRGLAPQGWHVSTGAEWATLNTFLGGNVAANNKMMTTGSPWNPINANATNASGFSGLPGGVRDGSGSPFYRIGGYGYWWTADNGYRSIGSQEGFHGANSGNPGYGFSVRLVNDEAAPFQAPPIVTNGLLLNLDAANPASYSGTGSTWTNLVTGNNVPSFSISSGAYVNSDGGVMRFPSTGGFAESTTGFANLTAYTLEVWVKSAGTKGDYNPVTVSNYAPCLFSEKVSGGTVNMVLAYNARAWSGAANNSYRYTAAMGGWATVEPTTNYGSDLNTWVQIVATYNGSVLKLYRNGVQIGSSTTNVNLRASSTGYYIAHRWDMTDGVYGDYSTVNMYSRALSDSEVITNYNAVKTRFGL